MTIQNEINKVLYTADGVQTIYAYTFRVDNAADMAVYIDGEVLASGWTIDGLGNPSGGNVTFSTAPADQSTISLIREIAIQQLVDYQEYDPFPANTHEFALDKAAMISQQLQEQLSRTLLASPDTPAGVDNTLPPYDAGKGIMWHETEQRMTVSNDGFNDIVSNAAASEANAATSESNAAASESKANQWANDPEDSEVDPGEYSAYHWAQKAASWASGLPSGSRIWLYNTVAEIPVGFSLLDIGDCLLGVSNGTTQLYNGANPGGNQVVGAWNVSLSIAGHAIVEAEMPNHIHESGVFMGSDRSDALRTPTNDYGTRRRVTENSDANGPAVCGSTSNTGGGSAHGHTGSVILNDANNRLRAAPGVLVEKD